MAAALAGTLSKMGRHVSGVDAPIEAADAFAAAWSQRARATIRVHRHCRVYRLTAAAAAAAAGAGAGGPAGARRARRSWRLAATADAGVGRPWVDARRPGAAHRLAGRVRDRGGGTIGSPPDVADELISYGGAVLWEAPQRTFRIREAAHYLVSPQHRDAAQAELVDEPAAMAAVGRPVAGTVRINMVYTLPERRRNGHAVAVTLMTSRAILAGSVPAYGSGAAAEANSEVVLIVDGNRPDRQVTRLGYQLVGERTVLRFGPATGPVPGLRATRPMPRMPTGPLPRLRRSS